jgi:hypothetical protein
VADFVGNNRFTIVVGLVKLIESSLRLRVCKVFVMNIGPLHVPLEERPIALGFVFWRLLRWPATWKTLGNGIQVGIDKARKREAIVIFGWENTMRSGAKTVVCPTRQELANVHNDAPLGHNWPKPILFFI